MGEVQDLVATLNKFRSHALVQLIVLLFAGIGFLGTAIKTWDLLRHLFRKRLTHQAEYDRLKKVRTGLQRSYLEDEIMGRPALTMSTETNNYDIAIYEEDEYLLKAVYDKDDSVGMYSVTVIDPSFKPPFRVAGEWHRLGECHYEDFPECHVLYATYSSKDIRYAESKYLANPGDYQDLLLATHWPPGTTWGSEVRDSSIVNLCHELSTKWSPHSSLSTADETVANGREGEKPNVYGFAAMGFDDAGRFAVGAVYAHVRALLRRT